ncbi:MAG: hypothetical protein GX757_09390 [Clostridiales bacterium]|nr:hypothetical protein [Clostridiales bacterium]
MKRNWKSKISKLTGNMRKLDRKILQLKASWDEVEDILNKSVKKKKKK